MKRLSRALHLKWIFFMFETHAFCCTIICWHSDCGVLLLPFFPTLHMLLHFSVNQPYECCTKRLKKNNRLDTISLYLRAMFCVWRCSIASIFLLIAFRGIWSKIREKFILVCETYHYWALTHGNILSTFFIQFHSFDVSTRVIDRSSSFAHFLHRYQEEKNLSQKFPFYSFSLSLLSFSIMACISA